MTIVAWIAAIVLFLQAPVPLYWFVLHPAKKFWSTHRTSAYVVALAFSWLPVTLLLFAYHDRLFRRGQPPIWRLILGLFLVAVELWMFRLVRRDLGGARLVGATELSGGGEIEDGGIYATIRHPRYTGSFLALVGACLLAATRAMWIAAAIWLVLMLIAIAMEESELRRRFGADYQEYCRRVPRFIPRPSLQRQKRPA